MYSTCTIIACTVLCCSTTVYKATGHDSSVVMPLGMKVVPRSMPASGKFFREDLFMRIFLPLPLFQDEQLSLNGIECTLSAGKLSLGGLTSNSVVRITDMASAVYCGCKANKSTRH